MLSDILQCFHLGPEKTAILKGPVVKLVLKDRWGEHRWNDRWLELYDGNLRYCSDEDEYPLIDLILASDIKSVQLVDTDAIKSIELTPRSVANCRASSVLDELARHRHDLSNELSNSFLVTTKSKDSDNGREYLFRASSRELAQEWVDQIMQVVQSVRPESQTLSKLRNKVRSVYDSGIYVFIITCLIGLNFFAFAYETQARFFFGTEDTYVLIENIGVKVGAHLLPDMSDPACCNSL